MDNTTEKHRYVFISHSNLEPDKTITNELYKFLCDKKVSCWYDKNLEANDYDSQIGGKLKKASAVVLVASKNSLVVRPDRVVGELRIADHDDLRIPIVPFAIDDTIRHADIDDGALMRLNGNSKQTVFLSAWPSKQEAFEQLYKLLGTLKLTELKNNPDDFEYDKSGSTLLSYKGVDWFVEVPDFIETIGEYAFKNCAVQTVSIPANVSKINDYAFLKCNNLTSIEGMAGVTECSSLAFDGTPLKFNKANGYSLNGVVIGGEVDDDELIIAEGSKTIADNAFELGGFTKLVLPDGLENIGQNAFSGCMGLTSVRIPSSVKRIGKNAFQTCLRLKEVIFEERLPDGFDKDYIFKGVKNLSIKVEG